MQAGTKTDDAPDVSCRAGPFRAGVRTRAVLGGLSIWSAAASAHLVANDVVVNRQGESYDTQPSLGLWADGTGWIAWKAYHRGAERILGRSFSADEAGPIIELSPAAGIHDGPHLLPTGDGGMWLVWSTLKEDRWRIGARSFDGRSWRSTIMLSDGDVHAFKPVATHVGADGILAAWQALAGDRFEIQGRAYAKGQWGDVFRISSGDADSFRPVLTTDHDGAAWCFWDQYTGRQYQVHGRRIRPGPGRIERLSPADASCMKPTAVFTNRAGLCVAWLRVQDVIGGEGAIDQLHTLEMATRTAQGWPAATDSDGDSTAATLAHGLLARMKPRPGGIWGYLGRRRHPMLLADGPEVWLLWERKSEHTGGTPVTTGQLLGRRFRESKWGPPVLLHEGLVDYHLSSPARAVDGRFAAVGSDLPRQRRRIYHRITVDLAEGRTVTVPAWEGWKPVTLPLEASAPRHHLDVDGQRYHLFWADTHCHSGLTADAEGEIDELLHYARDKARLDFVVIQENDEIYNCPLTESEFALGRFFSNWISRRGSMLALPGYEWTQRVPRDPAADPAEYIGWPRKPGTIPNHRTVIFPPAGGPLVRWTEVNNDIAALCHAVEQAHGILHTQHWDFRLTDRRCETNIEVTSGWDVYIRRPEHVHAALDAGHHLGFVGTSDSHRRNPGLGGGLTGVYARSLSPAGILEAYRSRRVFATSGSHLVLDARINGRPMGQIVRTSRPVEIALDVRGTRPILEATVVRDGEDLKTFSGSGQKTVRFTLTDTPPDADEHYYYWRVRQEGEAPLYPSNVKVARGTLAWSSPHWVRREK